MTLFSNQENTAFRIRYLDEDEAALRPVGKGKILDVVVERGRPLEVRAKPDGYAEKTVTVPEPLRNAYLQFVFEISDREPTIPTLPPTAPTIRFTKAPPGEVVEVTQPLECLVESAIGLHSVTVYVNDRIVAAATRGERNVVVVEGRIGLAIAWMDAGAAISGRVPLEAGRNVLVVEAKLAGGQAAREFRVVSVVGQELRRKPIGQRWAVIVGISEYQYSAKGIPNLQYAAKDAQAVYGFLRSEQGGAFPAENMRLLVNEEATRDALREALLDFLKAAQEDDFVVIYLSCHGAPEPGRPDNLHLIAADTDPERMASTGVPMWEIETALTRQIRAERVLVLADSCHSAGVGGVPGVKGGSNLINKYVQLLAETRPGRAIFTASEVNEASFEGPEFGGGHGAFSYFLLEGLKGAADENRDEVVSLGEAIDYTREKVRRATGGKQHPDTAGQIDRSLPLSVLR